MRTANAGSADAEIALPISTASAPASADGAIS
jgi:hypothetical protein